MQYSDQFLHLYNLLGASLPVDEFAKRVNLKALGLSSKAELYKPVTFTVHMTERNLGALKIDVPVVGNAWYDELRHKLAGTAGLKSVPSELRTVTGQSVKNVPVQSLAAVGTLYAYDNKGKRLVIPALPTKVPVEFSSNKQAHIDQWHAGLVEQLPGALANELVKHKDAASVDMALEPNGAVHTLVNQLVRSSVPDWPNHVRTHHVRNMQRDPEVVLKSVGNSIMRSINTYLQAGSEQVHRYLASVRGGGHGVLIKSEPVKGNRPINGQALYSGLIERALACPTLQRRVSEAIHVCSNFEGARLPGTKNRPAAANAAIAAPAAADHHPWFSHMHHTLLPMRGTYPSDYLARHTHQDMSAKAPFYGDVKAAYDAYHLMAGLHSIPPGAIIKNGTLVAAQVVNKAPVAVDPERVPRAGDVKARMRARLAPMACPAHEEEEEEEEMGASIAPPVRPLTAEHLAALQAGLEPINCPANKKDKEEDEDPEGVPRAGDMDASIGSSVAPPVRPLTAEHLAALQAGLEPYSLVECGDPEDGEDYDAYHPSNDKIASDHAAAIAAGLVPVEAETELEDDFSHLPTVDDVWA